MASTWQETLTSPRVSPSSAGPPMAVGAAEGGALRKRKRRWVARDVSVFEELELVGEGTYGQVWKARDKQTDEIVALKKVRMDNEREGFPLTAIREIKLLNMLGHPNIVKLKEIVTDAENNRKGRMNIYMVFEYMDHDLTGLMDTPDITFTVDQIKCYMLQLLEGLAYCHQRDILHRDIKGSNLLLNDSGVLKIADFGLARTCGENGRQYTNRVITLWYRPPELLLGANNYGPAVDMWSVGCLLAELLNGSPLFPGKDEADQLDLIFRMLGSPTPEVWPDYELLPRRNMIRNLGYAPRLRQSFQRLSADALDLLDKLLALDDKKRLSAKEALNHRWFRTEPLPCDRSRLPHPRTSAHEYQAKKRRQGRYAAGGGGGAAAGGGGGGAGGGGGGPVGSSIPGGPVPTQPRRQGPSFGNSFGFGRSGSGWGIGR